MRPKYWSPTLILPLLLGWAQPALGADKVRTPVLTQRISLRPPQRRAPKPAGDTPWDALLALPAPEGARPDLRLVLAGRAPEPALLAGCRF